MTKFNITESLKEILFKYSVKFENNDYITHQELINFYQTYKPTKNILELMRLTNIYKEPKSKPKPKDPKFIKQLEYLRLKLEEEEYQSLVNSSNKGSFRRPAEDDLTPAQFNKEVRHQLSTILNILISVLSVMYAIWYWTDTSMNIPISYRVLLSLFFGLVVLVAEVVVYLGYLTKIDEAQKKERSKSEIKNIIETVTFSSKFDQIS